MNGAEESSRSAQEDPRGIGASGRVAWAVVSFFGWLAGYIVSNLIVGWPVFQVPFTPALVIGSVIEGTIIGLAQLLCLRRWLARSSFHRTWGTWIIATGLGWGIGLRVISVIGTGLAGAQGFGLISVAVWIIAGAIGAAILGVAQGLALVGSIERAERWVPLTAACGAVAIVPYSYVWEFLGGIPDCWLRGISCGTATSSDAAFGNVLVAFTLGIGVLLSVGVFAGLNGVALGWLLKREPR